MTAVEKSSGGISMTSRWLRIGIFASALLLTAAPSFARAAAVATPPAAVACAVNPDLAQHPALLPDPPHVVRQYVVVGETSTGTAFNDAFGSTYCIDPNTAIMVEGKPAIQQRGLTAMTVIEGSLTVTLVGKCAALNCTTAGGSARIGHVESSNQVTWTVLAIGGTATLKPGDTAIFEDVVINASSGADKTIVATVSTVQNNPGGGCIASCWQFG